MLAYSPTGYVTVERKRGTTTENGDGTDGLNRRLKKLNKRIVDK